MTILVKSLMSKDMSTIDYRCKLICSGAELAKPTRAGPNGAPRDH